MNFKSLGKFCLATFILVLWPAFSFPAGIQAYGDEAGFVTIDPVSFYFHLGSYYSRLALKSSTAKIWYSYLAADGEGDDKPLFVFFNGGPGSATSCGLMSMNTGRWSLETNGINPGDRFVPNPDSWTKLGHLLYIDSRQTGFSYNLMANPESEEARLLEFNAQNFNTFFDAADFIRVLLSFFDAHPDLRSHRVILVPESYGGTRATLMLYLLLHYGSLNNGLLVYQDPDLFQRLQDHFSRVFSEVSPGQLLPPETIARQFSHQVMIQPAITLSLQDSMMGDAYEKPGSVIFQLAAETGTVYTPVGGSSGQLKWSNAVVFVMDVCLRDIYAYNRPLNNLDDGFGRAAQLLRTVANLSLVTGTDVSQISDLYASSRSRAYRVVSESDQADQTMFELPVPGLPKAPRPEAPPDSLGGMEGDMADVFGALKPWDRYMIELNGKALNTFSSNTATDHGFNIGTGSYSYGYYFLDNIRYVKTFITNAAFDLRVYTPILPQVLAWHSSMVSSAEYDPQSVSNEVRAGRIVVLFKTGESQVIRFPHYSASGHAVSYYEPEAFLEDVSHWLVQTGVSARKETGPAAAN